jgi:hypothetical protein
MQNTARVLCLVVCLGFVAGTVARGQKATAEQKKVAEQEKTTEGGEKQIAKTDLPAPVLAAFQKAYPKATIKGASMESEGGKTYYEIESLDGKVKRDLLYLANGTVTEIEESVTPADLPPSVITAVSTKHPSGKIEKLEKVTRGAVVAYDVVVKSGKTTYEMSIDPTGKVLKESKATGKKEGEEEEEKEEKEEKD